MGRHPQSLDRWTLYQPGRRGEICGKYFEADLAWCRQRGSIACPCLPGSDGATWNNGPSDQIPRLRGQFLWSQFASQTSHASMVYVAMSTSGRRHRHFLNTKRSSGKSHLCTYEDCRPAIHSFKMAVPSVHFVEHGHVDHGSIGSFGFAKLRPQMPAQAPDLSDGPLFMCAS